MSILPTGYTQLKYIEGTGTQCINTLIQPTEKTFLLIQFAPTNLTKTEWWFGVRSSNRTEMFGFYSESDTVVYDFFGSSTSSTTIPSLSGEIVTLQKGSGVTNLLYGNNEEIINNSSSSFTSSLDLYLFTANLAGSIASSTRCSGKLYGCSIYEDNILVRQYIPCQNPEQNIGLYDMVNSVFYENVGTGTFVAGPEVLSSNIYAKINGIWEPISNIYTKINNTW